MSHILLLPFGTSGSVFPFIWLGRKLIERGHRVSMIASPIYQKPAQQVGFDFFGVEPDELSLMLKEPGLWDSRSFKQVAFSYGGRAVAPCMVAIDRVIRELGQPDGMLAPMISFGARIAREKYGIPLITVHLYPAALMSADDFPLVLPGFAYLRSFPLAIRKFILSLPSPYDVHALPAVNQSCKAYGVEPPKRLWKAWHHSPDGVLALFPAWFAGIDRDQPDRCYQWDFPLEDMAQQHGMQAELVEFLAAGEKPILFTAGTGQYHAAEFFKIAAQVTQQLGRRAVFLTMKPEQVPSDLPDSIFVAVYAPFSLLLPHGALMVHHGGVGTLSQCFAAGIPQLVTYMSLDQPDNAARIERLGVGLSLPIKRLTAQRLLPLIQCCLEDPNIQENARLRAEDLKQRRPASEMFDWLESNLRSLKAEA